MTIFLNNNFKNSDLLKAVGAFNSCRNILYLFYLELEINLSDTIQQELGEMICNVDLEL